MIKSEEFDREIRDNKIYRVYEVTYMNSVPVDRTVISENLNKQEARDRIRELRDALDKEGVLTKGYGFEVMSGTTDAE